MRSAMICGNVFRNCGGVGWKIWLKIYIKGKNQLLGHLLLTWKKKNWKSKYSFQFGVWCQFFVFCGVDPSLIRSVCWELNYSECTYSVERLAFEKEPEKFTNNSINSIIRTIKSILFKKHFPTINFFHFNYWSIIIIIINDNQ